MLGRYLVIDSRRETLHGCFKQESDAVTFMNNEVAKYPSLLLICYKATHAVGVRTFPTNIPIDEAL